MGHGPIKVTAIRDPAKLPHKDLDVDIALECTGLFTAKEKAAAHLTAGAKRVLISAPGDGVDKTIVFGVNHDTLTADDIGRSPTPRAPPTALAPVAKVLHDLFGIERGYMTTIHSYTGDQPTLDTMHKDLYRGRAAALSMIPTSTGAAKALGLVIPALKGKLDGSSIRVPDPERLGGRPDGRRRPRRSRSRRSTPPCRPPPTGPMKGVLAVTNDPLVSIDFNHIAASSTAALPQTQVVDGGLARVLSWYDNEWGFSTRMADTALAMAKLI